MKALLQIVSITAILSGLLAACDTKEGVFFAGALGLGETRIYVASTAANSAAVAVYDVNGKFLGLISDYNLAGDAPFGLATFDSTHIVASINGVDRLDKIDVVRGGHSSFAVNAQFTGNIFGVARDLSSNYYAVETNTIEKFDFAGNRYPASGATPYISTPLNSCVLSTPHGITGLNNGYIAVVSSGGTGGIGIYNVSGATAACAYYQTFSSQQPWDVIQHSDGYLYVVTQANDGIYRVNTDGTGQTLLWNTATATYNPFALAEMPDGTLLVANGGNNSIDRFTTAGVFLGTFLKNSLSNTIYDILVVRGQ